MEPDIARFAPTTPSRINCNNASRRGVDLRAMTDESLDNLHPLDVFERFLDEKAIEKEKRDPLIGLYQEVFQSLTESDLMAE